MVENKQEPLPYLSTDCKGVSGYTCDVNTIRENLFHSWLYILVAKEDLG